jgi:hypothetical protein
MFKMPTMNTIFLFSARMLAVTSVLVLARGFAVAGEVTLEDNSLLVAFDSDSGALTRLENKETHWNIERRPELGVSFRMFAPLPERRYNPILGQKQHASEVEKISDHEVQLQWKNLASDNGGVLPMTFTADVTLTNGTVVFSSELINDSPLTVETIDYPYFGDFNPPARTASLEARVRRDAKGDDLRSDEVYPRFHNEKGYWGVFWPLKNLEAQQSPFCLIQAPGEGVCIGVDALKEPYRLQYSFEQHPGVISSVTDLVPEEDEISGTPVHLEFRTCHFVFAHPHSTRKLMPIILRCYGGGQQTGLELYKQWRSALVSQTSK